MSGPRFARFAVELSPADLLSAAKSAAGTTTDADLARRLADFGLDAVSTARSIPRWRKGETQPQYAAAVALFALAGWLNEDRVAASLDAARAAAEEAERLARDIPEPQPREERETG